MSGWKLLLISCAGVTVAVSEPYSVRHWTIDSGGGTSSSARFQVIGTIGQPESGATSTGNRFSMSSGFWHGIRTIQVTGLPTLRIRRSGQRGAVLSWVDNGIPVVLEQSPSGEPGSWSDSERSILTTGGRSEVSFPAVSASRIFRLRTAR